MKHLFIIPNNNMNPIASKGDLAIFEHIKLGYRMANSIYIIEYKGVQMIARIQLLILDIVCIEILQLIKLHSVIVSML